MNGRQILQGSIVLLSTISLLVPACDRDEAGEEAEVKSERMRFPHRKEMETGEDGLVRLREETDPYTGVVIHRDGERTISYFASYEEGKPHGPEIHYHENGKIRKILDFHYGEKVHHREWFENGNQEMDAMMKDGLAFGRHLRWFDDGSLRFSAQFLENLRWDGPVMDVSPEGKVMWDAVFKNGKYVSGIYPEEAQENLMERGLVKPADAQYPIKDGGDDSEENAN